MKKVNDHMVRCDVCDCSTFWTSGFFFSFLKDSEILFSDSIPDGNFLLKFSHFEVDSCLFRSGL